MPDIHASMWTEWELDCCQHLANNAAEVILDEGEDDLADKKKTTGPYHNSRYKAKMCKNWVQNGSCPYNEKCQFAHGSSELFKWASIRKQQRTERKAAKQQWAPQRTASPVSLPKNQSIEPSKRYPRFDSTESSWDAWSEGEPAGDGLAALSTYTILGTIKSCSENSFSAYSSGSSSSLSSMADLDSSSWDSSSVYSGPGSW
eukprot:CAMPEP_0203762618 /NCGR_PEP_ID=MMETSP0098-20131031/15462_1 /ASSEMBLY_ACC=CAM_ASM_000208 /TAXON_ID=96639 /ORGANISM=" , Strain NY0313808BC1" /LENGTH=201 /DNA_ID=CAMNT_0050657099 /DNA_START=320 /DNA_END=922 /DNA_ORIENTATION=+